MLLEEFTFLSSDNKTNVYAICCTPKDGKFTRIMQIIHGMTEHIGRYLHFCEYLTTKGFLVIGHDQLGHGKTATKPEDYGYYGEPDPNALAIDDIHKLRVLYQNKYPNLPFFMLGHSMGSYLLRQYISNHSERLAGALIIGTGYVPYCTTVFGINMVKILTCFKGSHHRSNFLKNMSLGTSYYKKYDLTKTDPTNSWVCRDAEVVKKFYDDKMCQFDFTLNGYLTLFQAVQNSCNPSYVMKIKRDLPIIFVSGDCDPVGSNGEGVKKAYELMKSIGSLDVTMKLYNDARHEVLNETNKEEVYEYLLKWLDEKTLLFEKNKSQ